MNIRALRQELGLSQEAFAALVGLRSKGQVSQLENGLCGVGPEAAIKIEELSVGRIPAHTVSRTLAAADAARQRN